MNIQIRISSILGRLVAFFGFISGGVHNHQGKQRLGLECLAGVVEEAPDYITRARIGRGPA